MRKTIILFHFLFWAIIINAQLVSLDIDAGSPKTKFKSGEDVIEFMHQKYKQAPCKAYSFSQKNTHYSNDSIIGHSVWQEFIEFPDKFRINFDEIAKGDFVIFKNDSSFNYKRNILKKKDANFNTLLLLLGGIYYRDIKDVIMRLKKENYNTQLLSTQKWKKQSVYVVGALPNDTLSNQIWVSKKNYRVVRIIEKMNENSTMDISFDAFQKSCNGYMETKVTFKRNGKIEQVEEYYDIKALESFPVEVFNPKKP